MKDIPLLRSSVITCILNGKAGSDQAGGTRDKIAALFATHGVEANILLARTGAELPDLARRAMEAGSQPVVAGGGDGTLNAVAGVLAGTGHALGVLPLGTLNHFAKDLGVPLALEAAVETLFTGALTHVDVGEVNGHIFLNNSSLGLYPAIVREREELQRHGNGKWVAFARASVSIWRSYAPMRVRLRVDSQDEGSDETPFVFVGNNRYEAEGSRIGERDRLDGGRLWICRAPRAGRGALLRLALQALVGRGASGELAMEEAADCWILTRAPRLRVARDGEVSWMETPLHYRSRPGELGVIVPAGEGAAR